MKRVLRIFAVLVLAAVGAGWNYRRELSFPPPPLVLPDSFAARMLDVLPVNASDHTLWTPELQAMYRDLPDQRSNAGSTGTLPAAVRDPDPHRIRKLEERLPADFALPADLEHAIDAIHETTRTLILVDWDALASEGVRKETPVKIQVANHKLADAIGDVLRAAEPARHSLRFTIYHGTITISNRSSLAPTVPINYNVSDMIAPLTGGSFTGGWFDSLGLMPANQLAADLQSRLGEHWDPGGAIIVVSRTFRVIQPLETQLLLDRYIMRQRWYKRHITLAARIIAIVTLITLLATMIEIGLAMRQSRRRKLEGSCAKCGYDLRATPDRCPECGTPVAIQPASR